MERHRHIGSEKSARLFRPHALALLDRRPQRGGLIGQATQTGRAGHGPALPASVGRMWCAQGHLRCCDGAAIVRREALPKDRSHDLMISIRLSRCAALTAIIVAGSCAHALAADVSLDNLTFTTKDGGSATIKHVEFDGTNLSKDEVMALFSATSTRETRAPIITKMQATKILVPEVVFVDKDKAGTITFHEFQATGVNAGKVEHMSLTSFDGSGTASDIPGQMTLHSGAIALDGGDFSKLLPALRDGDLTNAGTSQINHFSWQGFTLTVPDKDTPATAAGGNLYKIALASLVGQATYSADLPATASGELKDLTIEPPKTSEFGQQLAAFGV